MIKLLLLMSALLGTAYATSPYDDLSNEEKNTIHIYHEVVSSVVNVSTKRIADSFFYGRVEVPQGSGTGFIWDDQGHIVTNYHVVQKASKVVITFHNDKNTYNAKVIGVAPRKDIAVLKLEKIPKNLKAINVGSSKNLLVGQIAMAIGNPFGLDHSISKGIISALGRKIDGIGRVKIHDMIQTDAAINQGNSGGPLLNSKGQLIGMNTMIYSTSGSSAGLGFAVPVDTISKIAPQLIKYGKVIRPVLGINILDHDKKISRFDHIKKGAIITYVDPEGAAHKAGLKGMMRDEYGRIYLGDIITKINGVEVNSRDDISYQIERHKVGDTISVTYKRKNRQKTIKVKLKEL